jgi:hypothetical protein
MLDAWDLKISCLRSRVGNLLYVINRNSEPPLVFSKDVRFGRKSKEAPWPDAGVATPY